MSDQTPVVRGNTLPATADAVVAGLTNLIQSSPVRAGGIPFLRLLQDGLWVYGPDDVEPNEGSEWAVNPHTFQHGYVCWVDSRVAGESMVPQHEPPPMKSSLQDYGGDWDWQLSVQLMCIADPNAADGESDVGQTVLYKVTSHGGLGALDSIIHAIVAQAQLDPKVYVPAVTLSCDSYKHKEHGKTYTPVIEISRFVDMNDLSVVGAEETAADEIIQELNEAEPEPEPPPAAANPPARARGRGRGKAAAAAPAATAPAAEKPKGRAPRRRRG